MAARLIRWAALRRSVLILLLVRLALGVAYSVSVPPWEADNEDSHFAYARYIAVRHTLPQPNDPEAESIWEKFQPPLYYLLLAPVLLPFDLGEAFEAPDRYPYAPYGNAGVNYNIPAAALTATTQALYVARWLSVLLSTASVAAMYGAARLVWPRRRALVWAATLLYAFWPQFLFTGSMVTNDVLVTALAALSFYLSVQIVTRGLRLRWALALSLCLGAALLTKLNGLALLPAAGVALAMGAARHPARRAVLAGGVAVLAIGGGLAYLGSLDFVTGQIFRAELLQELAGVAPNVASLTTQSGTNLLAWIASYGFRTFVASYGWGNVEAYGWLYPAWALGAGLAGTGIVVAIWRRGPLWPKRVGWVMGAQALGPVVLATALAVAQRNLHIPGRYYLPALPAVACLLIAGWHAGLPSRWQASILKITSLGIVLTGASIPLTIFIPSYALPLPLTAPPPNPTSIRFGDSIELVGYDIPSLTAGARSPITLCWQTHAPLTENYSVLLEVVGSDGQGYERLQTYPGHGNYATTLWEPGRAFCDAYTLSIGADIPAPSMADLRVALLTTTDTNGPRLSLPSTTELYATFPVKVAAGPKAQPPALAHSADIRFNDVFRLRGYELITAPDDSQRRVTVVLLWEALQTPATDYTVFAHLRDTPQSNYAQADSAPQAGRYPTALWAAGELVRDPHTFELSDYAPPVLDLYVGWVDAEGNRLPAVDAEGQAVANNEVILEHGLIFRFPVPPHYTDFFYLPLLLKAELPPSPAPALAPYP